MSGPFNVGDVVVCVDPKLSLHPGEVVEVRVSLGSIHRVSAIMCSANGLRGILLDGERPHTCWCCEGEGCWRPERFRHLPKADDDFTAEIRACRPIKRSVDA